MKHQTILEMRVEEAKAEAERFLKKCRKFELAEISTYPSRERAALKRSAIDCGHAMAQIGKSNH
jgi:hypothetical protein